MKGVLLGLLIFAVLAPELPRFAGKAMGLRALTYPIAALVVPAVWLLRRPRGPYPHLLDALLVLPFVVDTAGNALELFDTVNHFDDLAHGLNWALLTAAFGAAVARTGIGRLNAAGLAVGFGATTHVLWELGEYVVMTYGSNELDLTYTDTIGDLAVSLAGTMAGALATVTALWARERAEGGR